MRDLVGLVNFNFLSLRSILPQKTFRMTLGILESIALFTFMVFVVAYFYIGASIGIFSSFLLTVLFLTLVTDGFFVFYYLTRRPVVHKNLSFDPKKLTIVIACYNGEKIIGKTIDHALRHVPADQIIVVSDKSTDNTIDVAKAYGVQVHQNQRNVNKAFSISGVMHMVKTPYVLILDDDTLIGDTFIPTSLLDKGYSAVSFNVMPIKTGTFINKMQMFEYRKSMFMGKSLRGKQGAVGNVSGAIGLYRTEDLQSQVYKHSGQFGGEDQQRTTLVHLYSNGKGVTYTDSAVYTLAPDTFKSWRKQRSLRWNLASPELFFLNLRMLFKPNAHSILKFEKGYQMYLLLTDPVRMLFFWIIIIQPLQASITYLFYVFLCSLVWMKIGRKDPFWIVFVYPFYSMFERLCRFVAHFYWFKIKYKYIFKEKYHKMVQGRNLLLEYIAVMVFLAVAWGISVFKIMSFAYPKISEAITNLQPERATEVAVVAPSILHEEPVKNTPAAEISFNILIEQGDGKTHIARKAISQYVSASGLVISRHQLVYAEDSMRYELEFYNSLKAGDVVNVQADLIETHLKKASKLSL